MYKLRTEVRNLSEKLVTGAGRPNMTNGAVHGRRGRPMVNMSPDREMMNQLYKIHQTSRGRPELLSYYLN